MKSVIVMSASDNVGNVIEDVAVGEQLAFEVDGKTQTITSVSEVPYAFKVALRDIPEGGEIIKYKEVIGKASQHIKAGECVHVHNIAGTRGRGDIKGAGK